MSLPFTVVLSIALLSNVNIKQETHKDCVPDEQTAIKIAEAVWYPLYGDDIYDEKPYNVILEDGFWIVTGSLPDSTWYGGTAYIKFKKSDCQVVNVYHTK
ncbi:MAG: hypothetical protein IPL12_01605 [Bacteroidetes bacterium]|nr:hypothetical protein [Bacteroidota bacterium]